MLPWPSGLKLRVASHSLDAVPVETGQSCASHPHSVPLEAGQEKEFHPLPGGYRNRPDKQPVWPEQYLVKRRPGNGYAADGIRGPGLPDAAGLQKNPDDCILQHAPGVAGLHRGLRDLMVPDTVQAGRQSRYRDGGAS